MNLVAKAFDEGVKAAIKIFRGAKFDAQAVAKGMDSVRRAMQKAVNAAAKAGIKK